MYMCYNIFVSFSSVSLSAPDLILRPTRRTTKLGRGKFLPPQQFPFGQKRNGDSGTSLVVQGSRLHLAMAGT